MRCWPSSNRPSLPPPPATFWKSLILPSGAVPALQLTVSFPAGRWHERPLTPPRPRLTKSPALELNFNVLGPEIAERIFELPEGLADKGNFAPVETHQMRVNVLRRDGVGGQSQHAQGVRRGCQRTLAFAAHDSISEGQHPALR